MDDNLERDDVGARWERKVQALGINDWIAQQQASIRDELNGRLTEFTREMSVETDLASAFEASGPQTFDPWDVKRTMKWGSAISAALAGVAVVAEWIGAAEFWNPIGWAAGAVGVLALGLSWLFGDRETKVLRQKAKAAEQLRGTIDKIEQHVRDVLRKWLSDSVGARLMSGIRSDAQSLYNGMFDIAGELDDGSTKVGEIVEGLNRRLMVRSTHRPLCWDLYC